MSDSKTEKTFGEDVATLRAHVETIVLRSPNAPAAVAVVPAYQGRVMTSTAGGDPGVSFGWINDQRVASREPSRHIHVYGGEERFWLGPEGGQFSLFFPPGAPFALEDWQTPALIDTQPFPVVASSATEVTFRKEAELENYARTRFRFAIDRRVELLDALAASESLGVAVEGLPFVGYRTSNRLTNTGDQAWRRETGLLSIWLLGMYKPGRQTTVVVPFRPGPDQELGPIVNDAYFGRPPSERLVVREGVLFFSGDGRHRAKIGLSPRRSLGVCGSFDAERGVLTIVKYNQPDASVTEYVNSMWALQDSPYAGDAINSYNDGPPAPGEKPLGPFYELETSSPALALAPGATATHVQETYHLQGQRDALDRVAAEVLGVSLAEIESALR